MGRKKPYRKPANSYSKTLRARTRLREQEFEARAQARERRFNDWPGEEYGEPLEGEESSSV